MVEWALAWLLGCRRLGMRYEWRVNLLQGLPTWPVRWSASGSSIRVTRADSRPEVDTRQDWVGSCRLRVVPQGTDRGE